MVYGLRQRGTSEIRYVGKTDDLRRRMRHHLKAAQQKEARYVYNWIRSVDFDVEAVVLEERPLDSVAAEVGWIAKMRAEGARLTNLTDGGDGTPGHRHTAETKAKLRRLMKARMARPEYRAKLSQSHKARWERPGERARVGDAKRGTTHSPETRAKMSASHRGRIHSEETRAKMSASMKRYRRDERARKEAA